MEEKLRDPLASSSSAVVKRSSTEGVSQTDKLAMINMVTQHDQLDSLILVNKQQSTDDQDDITSLAVTDLSTLSHLHDPEVPQNRQNQGGYVLKVHEVPQLHLAAPLVLDVREQLLEQPQHCYDAAEDL